MQNVILISVMAGVFGTGFGGLLGIFFGKQSLKSMSYVLSFAGGIMVSIVCFDLIPEALELSNIWTTIFGVSIGVVMVFLLNTLIDWISSRMSGRKNIEEHDAIEELHHQDPLMAKLAEAGQSNVKMIKAGIIMLCAIALHNLPEGMAIGSGTTHDTTLGIVLAIMIAIHNIPEGMAIAVPLCAGGMGFGKTIFLTSLSGVPTLFGAMLGFWIGNISEYFIALSLAGAGGAMLYVTYCEIMPQVILMNKGRTPAIFTLIGMMAGLLLIQLLGH
jgi:ZIP family zinc transporter